MQTILSNSSWVDFLTTLSVIHRTLFTLFLLFGGDNNHIHPMVDSLTVTYWYWQTLVSENSPFEHFLV